jgi:hypothetical protein
VHNGNGHRFGHGPGNGGSGKRWLLIALLVLGGFWLINDAYSDGYRDALVQTGQVGNARYYRGGPHFPWGLVIVGSIAFVAYRKGAFDRFIGPDGAFGPGAGGYSVQRYGGGSDVPPPAGPAFRGPRTFFDDWHRQAHEAEQARQTQPAAQPGAAQNAYAGPVNTTTGSGQGQDNGNSSSVHYGEHHHYQAPQAPAPTPPTPEYWTTLGGPAASGGAATTAPTAPGETRSGESTSGAPGATTERW